MNKYFDILVNTLDDGVDATITSVQSIIIIFPLFTRGVLTAR